MKISANKIKAIGKSVGVTIKIDKSLDKFSGLIPEKMKKGAEILAKSKLSY